MADYDGEDTYRALDEDAISEDEPLDTFVEHSLRNQEYWLHKNEAPVSKQYLSGGQGTDRDSDRPITSFTWSDFEIIPFEIMPDLDKIHVDLFYRVATSVSGNTEDVPVDFRIQLKGITAKQWTLAHQSGLGYRQIRLTLDGIQALTQGNSRTFLSLGIRGQITSVGQGAAFFLRSPAPQPHGVEDFEYNGTGPSNVFGGGSPLTGVPDAFAFEGKGIANSLDGNFTSCFSATGSTTSQIVEKEPTILPQYLGATSRVRNISYLQLRSFTVTPEYI